MGELASTSQLRMGFVRRAIVTVPLVLLLGIASGLLAGSGYGNPWFDALAKPAAMPPGWVFPVTWTILYVLMGLALAMILNARGARGRRFALALFALQLLLNLLWSPLFFALHQVEAAQVLMASLFVAAVATTFAFGRIRAAAAWAMVPYLAWLCFAALLTNDIRRLNPEASTLVTEGASTQIRF